MKSRTHSLGRLLPVLIVAGFTCVATAQEPAAQEPAPAAEDADIDALGQAAARFVTAFNAKDAAAIAALFLPSGEMIGRDGEVIRGTADIEARYRELFSGESVPQVALEASSVHLVAAGVAIEEGTLHFSAGESEPVRSVSYSATQVKQDDGSWKIASTRDLDEVTPPSEHLKPLAGLAGEWTYEGDDGVRTELALDFDASGNYLLGEAVATDADGDFQTISLRIGWNPASSSVFWWTFDSAGGNASGGWSRDGENWLIRTSGITADAEINAATQRLSFDGPDTLVWSSSDRVVAGETQPDVSIRFVRRAPEPAVEAASAPQE
jgi:uncharacterized protein (TIGR02246 family)